MTGRGVGWGQEVLVVATRMLEWANTETNMTIMVLEQKQPASGTRIHTQRGTLPTAYMCTCSNNRAVLLGPLSSYMATNAMVFAVHMQQQPCRLARPAVQTHMN